MEFTSEDFNSETSLLEDEKLITTIVNLLIHDGAFRKEIHERLLETIKNEFDVEEINNTYYVVIGNDSLEVYAEKD